ncbi:MAG: metalloprotease family protein [Ignisphaera sp.]
MSCRVSGCNVEYDLTVYLAVIIAIPVGLSALSRATQYLDSMNGLHLLATVTLVFTAITLAHEYIHYLVARDILGKEVKIRPLVSLGGLAIEYNEILWSEYICIALAPQVFITLPLAIAYTLTRDPLIYTQLGLHISASAVDLVNVVRALTIFKNCRFILCREDKKIVGYMVMKPDGRCTIYRIT